VQDAPPGELYARPATAGVARLSGPGALLAGTGHGAVADTPLGRVPLLAPAEGPVRIVVRPHQVGFVPGAGDARVTARRFAGPGWRLEVRGPAGALAVAWPDPAPPAPGTAGTLTLHGPCAAVPAS
jgi:iron(III) transport system ATP-binding protein